MIENVFAGTVKERWSGKPPSAIGKQPVPGRAQIAMLGLTVDQQADLEVHGGPDKALHHYPADHYAAWRTELGREDLLPGSYGENLSTNGLTEKTVCIGDVFRVGTAEVQVSQGRQPCWKLNAHVGETKLAHLFQKTGRTGWYYRVLLPGEVAAGGSLSLIERLHPDWSVERVTAARLTREVRPEEAAILARLSGMAERWRKAFEKMADGDATEDTRSRLGHS
ncbi:MAG: MOSC domain-containing protein [Roseovarius sp.]|uniref:MOSC domain-containing protein n=1 Tax=Roseovarius sp. TaxID=1486281 RepID=UPI0032ECFAB3